VAEGSAEEAYGAREAEDRSSEALFTPALLYLLLTSTLFAFASSCYLLLPKFLATELAADAAQIGIVGALQSVANLVAMPLVGGLVDRYGRRRFMFLAGLLMAGSSFLFVTVDAVGTSLYVLRALQGAAIGMFFIPFGALIADSAPPARMGQALGVAGATMLAMNALAPWMVETLAPRFGWSAVFVMAGAAALFCAALAFFIKEPASTPRGGRDAASFSQLFRTPGISRLAFIMILLGATFGVLFTFHQPWALSRGISELRTFFLGYAASALFVRLALGHLPDRLGRFPVALVALAIYGVAPLLMLGLAPGGLAPIGAVFGAAHGLAFPTLNAIILQGCAANERGKLLAIFNGSFLLGFGAGCLVLWPERRATRWSS